MPRPGEQIVDLADRRSPGCPRPSAIEQRLAGRRQRVVVAIGGARERARRADERPRDDAAEPRPSADQVEGDLARFVQLRRSGRRPRARRSETRCRPRCRRSACRSRMCSAPSSSMISVPDATTLPIVPRPMRRSNSAISSGGKPVGKRRKRAIEDDAHHLPVAGHRVLARRALRHPAERARAAPRPADAPRDRRAATRPSAASVGNVQRHLRGDVAERVAALVAVQRGIGQLADADAVEHDEDDAGTKGTVSRLRDGATRNSSRPLRGVAMRGDRVLEDQLVGARRVRRSARTRSKFLMRASNCAAVEQVHGDRRAVRAARSSGRRPGCLARRVVRGSVI